MRKLICILMALATYTTEASAGDTNPLLTASDAPYGSPRFTRIKLEHYIPAFETAIADAREGLDRIINNPTPADFNNTIVALERNGELLEHVSAIFFALNSSETSDQMDEIANQVQPMLVSFSNDVTLNEKLFDRVRTVYENEKDSPSLDTEQKMLLKETYRSFIRNGAGLNGSEKEKYRAITNELASLGLSFSQNVLAETNSYSLNIPPKEEHKVDYLPDFVREAMAEEAHSRGEEGWTVTLQAPSYVPFMTYSTDREMKEELWRKYNSLCYNDSSTGNKETVKRISQLRMELAQLMGHRTYADYVLEERMAENTSTVNNFLNELLVKTHGWAGEEYGEIVQYALSNDGPDKVMPWDFGYYSEKLKKEKYSINDEELKPYFELSRVENGVFMLAEKLFGITFSSNPDIEVYHPDVKAFEVWDSDRKLLGVLYMDYFPRASKRGGAWMTNFREMYTREDGVEVRPLVTLNFNYTKPTSDKPSLLTFNEVVTTLHEFGHGLHGLLAEGRYGSLTGTNVYRDFVELPSQLLENWAYEKEFLDMWAAHYKTGEKIPAELVEKIVAARDYLSAYGNVRQLSFGINDMAWHTIEETVIEDPATFERRATAPAQILPLVDGACFSTSFRHIFGGGYAAGYYSYKWAEVLEADAFDIFKHNGIMDRSTGERFRETILSKGGSQHPMTLYINFAGRKPDTEALINKIAAGR